MINTQYEDSINSQFVERVGQHLAKYLAGYTEAIDELIYDFESTIDGIPEYEDVDDEDVSNDDD